MSAALTPVGHVISTVAGAGAGGYGGDGGAAIAAQLKAPSGVAVDGAGNVYIADTENHRIRKVDSKGTITTVAGNGCHPQLCRQGENADNVFATQAQLNWPEGVAVDRSGNLYIADTRNGQIRRVDLVAGSPTHGVITTVAGKEFGTLKYPRAVATDGSGNLYIADTSNDRILKLLPGADGVINGGADEAIETVAGGDPCSGYSCTFGYSGDGEPAAHAQFKGPVGLAVDRSGSLYVADFFNHRIRKITFGTFCADFPACTTTVTNPVATIAGTTVCDDPNSRRSCHDDGHSGDGGPATEAQLDHPLGVAVDSAGNLYVADRSHRIRRVGTDGIITTVAGTGKEAGSEGDGGPAGHAQLDHPSAVAVDSTGSLFVVDELNHRVRRVGPDLLSVTMTDAPDPVAVNGEIAYSVTVRNFSSGSTTGVTLDGSLSDGVVRTATPSQGTCKQRNDRLTCHLRRLAAGTSATVTVTVTAPPSPPGSGLITSTATVRANETDAYPATNTAVEKTAVTLEPVKSGPRCGQVVTENTTLTEDVGPCDGQGLIIGRNGITLDLAGHRIYGSPGPSSATCAGMAAGTCGNAAGIRLPMRSKVTVTSSRPNGRVEDFDAGVVLVGGGGNTISHLLVRNNIGPEDADPSTEADDPFLGDGIVLFNSAGNRIQNNTVHGNGIYDGIGVLAGDSDGNVIEDNIVTDNGGLIGGEFGQGIIVNGASMNLAPVIKYTTLRKNTVRGNASAGISSISSVHGKIEYNTVEGNDGNGIGVGMGGATTEEAWMLVQRNEVHANNRDGIEILPRGRRSQILYNNASDNVAVFRGVDDFDLHDRFQCRVVTWLGNTWGKGLYSPECVTMQGSGPLAPSTTMEGSAAEVEVATMVRQVPPVVDSNTEP